MRPAAALARAQLEGLRRFTRASQTGWLGVCAVRARALALALALAPAAAALAHRHRQYVAAACVRRRGWLGHQAGGTWKAQRRPAVQREAHG